MIYIKINRDLNIYILDIRQKNTISFQCIYLFKSLYIIQRSKISTSQQISLILQSMLLRNHRKQSLKLRLAILIATSVIFIVSFVLNITLSQPLYDYNLNVVPLLQNNPVLGSSSFMTFMNVISLIFDPMVCAAYIFIIYLISYRKLQIIVFLLWFFVLSWLLGIMKMAIHQARPFWLPGSQVQMQSWTCYTDYGSPSGHSMLAIVLLQFLLRFFARVHHCVYKFLPLFYILIFAIQLLVMFSRVMLGMHSFNQVLFGLCIGVYSFIPYYLFLQTYIMKIVLRLFIYHKSMVTNIVLVGTMIVVYGISLLVALLPTYYNAEYWGVIHQLSGCKKVKQYASFQYSCLEGSAVISAGFGVILGFNYLKKPHNLAKILNYSRISLKFIGKLIITIVIGLIPIVIFLNPLWHKINTSIVGKALIIWACNNIAFFLAIFMILIVVPEIGEKFGLEYYKHPKSYEQYKRFEVINMLALEQTTIIVKRRETQMTDPRLSEVANKLGI